MTTILILTALLVIPAGFLIVIGDEMDPIEQAQNILKKRAKESGDRTQLRARLAELGKGNDQDYEDFRLKQYGYCAGAAAMGVLRHCGGDCHGHRRGIDLFGKEASGIVPPPA